MFGKKKPKETYTYDREHQRAVLKCSICNGEKVAGFKDLRTGRFEEVMLIRTQEDLAVFQELYGVETVTKEY